MAARLLPEPTRCASTAVCPRPASWSPLAAPGLPDQIAGVLPQLAQTHPRRCQECGTGAAHSLDMDPPTSPAVTLCNH